MKGGNLLAKVATAMRRLGLTRPGVVAVSGGPDSVALLRALVEVCPGPPDAPLIVAHLNHRLRGDEGDADEEFVRALHAELAARGGAVLGLRCDRIDVRAAAEGDNLEATARRIRYEWLAGVARVSGCGWVATGHTADDQAETVLHRLLRGSGLQGLRGIAVMRPLAEGVEVVRPLLGATRAEVLGYLEETGQPARQDRSNADLRLTRNRIRHELLPLLARDYNPGVVGVLTRLAEQAAEAFEDERRQAEALLSQAELPRAGDALVFDRKPLAAATRNGIRAMFRLAWEREGWPRGGMDFEHWDRLAGLALGEAEALELPAGLGARRLERTVLVGPAERCHAGLA